MPYDMERASRIGHLPVAQAPVITEALARWETPLVAATNPPEVKQRLHQLTGLTSPARPDISFAFAFDGSNQEVEVRAKYPSVRVGYIQIAGVAVRLDQFFNSRDRGLVDARRLRAAQTTQTIQAVLPGSQVIRTGMDGRDTWRAELFETFTNQTVEDFGAPFSLVDALLTLHGSPGNPATDVALGKCPTCGDTQQRVHKSASACTACGAVLYPTDLLRTHEEHDDEGSNVEILTRTMNVAERLLIVSYLDGFFRLRPDLLSQFLFITDGPLAFFGPTAPLRLRMIEYWGSMCTQLAERQAAPPLLVGIEKSGVFVDHAAAVSEFFDPQHVMLLDNKYISERIRRKATDSVYGDDTFYGRRFFYKTSSDQMLVVTVPRTPNGRPYEKAPTTGAHAAEQLSSYPTLRPTLTILDRLQTRLYPNAVIPVALSHSASSLPLGTGRNVLTLLAQEGLGLPISHVGATRAPRPTY